MLGSEGADSHTSGRIYVAVVQAVLMYGSEKWVMKLCIGRVLSGFHHRVAFSMTGRQPRRERYGRWVYALLVEAMEEAVLHEVETYIYLLQNTVTQLMTTRPIIDLCLAAERRTGSRVTKRWIEKEVLDLEGMQTAAREAEREEGGEEKDGAETETCD